MHQRCLLVVCLLTVCLSGCAMLYGGGGKGSSSARGTGHSRISNAIDEHEQAIDASETPAFRWQAYSLYNPADRNSQGEDAKQLRDRIETMDRSWAQKIGPRAQELVGDAHRTWSADSDLQQAAGMVAEACPTNYFDDRSTSHFEVLEKYAAFDKAASEALKANPEALHVWLQRQGQFPLDMVTLTLACEDHRQRELKRSDGLSESGHGPTDRHGYEAALLKILPLFPKAPYKEDHPTVTGCGYKDFLVEEQYMGGGRFGEAELSPLEGFDQWRPIKCNKFARPSRRYAREAALAKKSLNFKLAPSDHIYIPDNSGWDVVRDDDDQILSRHLVGRAFIHRAPLPLYCASKNPFDACYQGGSGVMLMYEAAKHRLADAHSYASANKPVHCRVAAWAAYGLAGVPTELRDAFENDGSWVEDMRYVPEKGAPMDERGLMRAADALRSEAKALFHKCGGTGTPPTGTEWAQVVTNQNHAPYRWAE